MKIKNKLNVIPVETAMVANLNAHRGLHGNSVRFLGYRFVDGKFTKQDAVVTVDSRVEYIKALQIGDLLPADEETARAAGVPFVQPSK